MCNEEIAQYYDRHKFHSQIYKKNKMSLKNFSSLDDGAHKIYARRMEMRKEAAAKEGEAATNF